MQEIINYPFDEIDIDDSQRSDDFERSPGEVFIDRPNVSNTEIKNVNGYNLPEDDDDDDVDEEEDDLILGDEDDLDEDDLEEDIDVEIDEDADDVSDDDLVLDADEDEDEEDDL